MLNYDFNSPGFVSSGRCEDIADIFEDDSIMGTVVPITDEGLKALESAYQVLPAGGSFTATLSNGSTLKVERRADG
jgi:hypothetical protein